MYHTSIAELLTHPYESENSNGLGAVIRLLSGPVGFSELISGAPGIQMALERVQIHGTKWETDTADKNFNVLRNLVVLMK